MAEIGSGSPRAPACRKPAGWTVLPCLQKTSGWMVLHCLPICEVRVEGLLGVNIHTVGVIIYFKNSINVVIIIEGGKRYDHEERVY